MEMDSHQAIPTLHYTGHPLVDIGLATMAAFANKAGPEDLAEQDLDGIAEYMRRNYSVNPLKRFLKMVFMNSGYVQAAYDTQPEKRELYAQRVLGAYRADTLDQLDPFLGLPVANVSYKVDGTLEPGRAFRQHIPLLNAEGVINFSPGGNAGIATSGLSMLAIQAFPLGCGMYVRQLLGVHSDNASIMRYFAGAFLQRNRMAILLAQQSGESLLPDPNQLPLTLLITTLLVANQMRADAYDEGGVAFSVTAYCLSNDGRRPLLEIHHLPFPVIGFLRQMNNAKYSRLWQAIVHRAWQRPKESKKGEGQPFEPRYNALYEDLFHLPDRAPQFIRRYFLRRALRRGRDAQDPRTEYSLQQEAEIVSWDIAAIFLGRIMAMEKDRINQIRDMGDRLAQYIVDQNDQRFFRIFRSMRREQYAEFRRAIIRASLESVDRGGMPLVDYDQYIEVFEEEDRLERTDWLLARDLVLIRIIEKLYQLRWLAQNIDGIVESDDLEEENQE